MNIQKRTVCGILHKRHFWSHKIWALNELISNEKNDSEYTFRERIKS